MQVAAFTFLALLALAAKTLRDTKGQLLLLPSSCTPSSVFVAVQRLTVMVTLIKVRLRRQQCMRKETGFHQDCCIEQLPDLDPGKLILTKENSRVLGKT